MGQNAVHATEKQHAAETRGQAPQGNGSSSRRERGRALPLLLTFASVLIVVPVYVIAGILLFRSGIFDFSSDQPPSEKVIASVWAFLGATLAASVSLAGLVVTSSHNRRTIAFQRDVEAKREIADSQTRDRLALDTAVASLGLIRSESNYAPRAAVAGALATLVRLGHPAIAMKCLSAAWKDEKVDAVTATWLIDQAFTVGDEEAQVEATALLGKHILQLTDANIPGDLEWPGSFWDKWPTNAALDARMEILTAAINLVLSRSRKWWGDAEAFAHRLLHQATLYDPEPALRASAAEANLALIDGHDTSVSILVDGAWTSYEAILSSAKGAAQETSERLNRIRRLVPSIEAWARPEGYPSNGDGGTRDRTHLTT